jgi:hypothetical protein
VAWARSAACCPARTNRTGAKDTPTANEMGSGAGRSDTLPALNHGSIMTASTCPFPRPGCPRTSPDPWPARAVSGPPDVLAGRLECGTGIAAGGVVLQPVSSTSWSSHDASPRPWRRLGCEQGDGEEEAAAVAAGAHDHGHLAPCNERTAVSVAARRRRAFAAANRTGRSSTRSATLSCAGGGRPEGRPPRDGGRSG